MGTAVSAFQSQNSEQHEVPTSDSANDRTAVLREKNVPAGTADEDEIEPEELARRIHKQQHDTNIDAVQAFSAKLSSSVDLMREYEQEVAMETTASKFYSKRKSEKNPFKYDEFESIRRAYQRDIVAKQMARITRSQNQAKLDKEVAADCFLRIHKAISDLEGWGPGLKLSSREGEWSVVGISKNSGASLSSIRLNDKLVTVDGNAVSGLTFDGVRAILLGPKDSKVVVVVSTKQFLFRVHREFVLIRSLPSASFNFSSQEVVQKTLMNAQFVENIELEVLAEREKDTQSTKHELLAKSSAIAEYQSALLTLQLGFICAPDLDDSTISLVHTTIINHVKCLGMPSFLISIHNRSQFQETISFSSKLADELSIIIRALSMEPAVNIIEQYVLQGAKSKSTWRSSIEQGASTNGIPVCVLIWDLEHWNIWQHWMQRHLNIISETNRSIDVYRKELLNFDDEDFIQEALHIFSAEHAAHVSRILVLIDDAVNPSTLVDSIEISLMQKLFSIKITQIVFIHQRTVELELSVLERMPHTSIESFFEKTKVAYCQYFFNLLELLLKNVSKLISDIHRCAPDIRKVLCFGKSVITSHFIPEKCIHFSSQEMVESYNHVIEQQLLKQPHHVVFYNIIRDWANDPVSTIPGKKVFFFTPEICGFSSVMDWVYDSLSHRPAGLNDIIPILVRVPKHFRETGLAQCQSLIYALRITLDETLSAHPYNLSVVLDSHGQNTLDSPELLMENLAKTLSIACKQLSAKILIMFDNIHYINFDAESMGCMQWAFSRMPQNVRIVFPFLLNTPMQRSLKHYVASIQENAAANCLDIELLDGLEYRSIPVLTSHQRFFFDCFVNSGTACQTVATKLCEDYFAWHLHVNPNMDSHIWLLIAAGYVMVHHLWNLGVRPLDIFLSSDLKSLICVIINDFSTILLGSTMLIATRIMHVAKFGITLTDIIKVMILCSNHRDQFFKQIEYHRCCQILFSHPGEAQALQRFCCIFARMQGDGFSTASFLVLNSRVHRLLEEVIFELYGPLPEIAPVDTFRASVFDVLKFSCNFEPMSDNVTIPQSIVSAKEGSNFISQNYTPGQLRYLLFLTDFALSVKDKKVVLRTLSSITMNQARIAAGCIHWVVGNILEALRSIDVLNEADINMVSVLFRSLISHKSRAPLLEIQPDSYYSIMSATPSKEDVCRTASNVLEQLNAPWLRHSNKQHYFQFPIASFADLPFAACSTATSKSGHLLAAGDFTGKLAVWRVSSSDLLCSFTSHSQAISGLAFSCLDYIIISCSSDCSININSLYSSSVLTTISPHSKPVTCLGIWRKDSNNFITVSRDGLAAIVTLNKRAIAARSSAWKAIKDGSVQNEYTDEELGTLLLQPSSSVFTFQVVSFDVLANNMHTNFVDCVACHPIDNAICATGSRDTSVFVWKIDFTNFSSRCMFRYLGHSHWILSLDWMTNDYSLLSSSMSSAIHVWRVPYERDYRHSELLTEIVVDAPSVYKQTTSSSSSASREKSSEEAIIVESSRYIAVQQSHQFPCTAHDAADFSEFDDVRMFIEREEREALQGVNQTSFADEVAPLKLNSGFKSAGEVKTNAEYTCVDCYVPSIALNLADDRFPWQTNDNTKQYASSVRFLGSESMWLCSIENESLTYDSKNGHLTSLFRGHTGKINSLAVSPVLNIFFTASSDKFVKAWDICRAPEYELLPHSSLSRITVIIIGNQFGNLYDEKFECTFFFGCSDGSLGANTCQKNGLSETMTSIDTSLSSSSVKHNSGISSMSYFRNFKMSFPDVVASGDENGGIMLWNASERKPLQKLASTRTSPIVASHFFLPAVAAGEELHLNLFTVTGDAFCVVWNAETGSALRFINLPVPAVSHVQICTECSLCTLRTSGSNSFTLFDYSTLADMGVLKAQFSETERLTSLTLSHNGERCVVGSSNGNICVLESYSRQIIAIGKHHQKGVSHLLWTHFMNRVVSCSADKTIAFWDGCVTPSSGDALDGEYSVFTPITVVKLDAKLTVIQKCANIPWLLATMDEDCASFIWNVATATVLCKIATHNSSPTLEFYGKALCIGQSSENCPIVYALELADTLDLVRGKSSLLSDANDNNSLRQERQALKKWRTAFSTRC